MALKTNDIMNLKISSDTQLLKDSTMLVLWGDETYSKMFSYLIGKEMVLMTDIFLAFSLLFIFIIVGFWIMSKIDRFINSLRDKLQKDDAMEDDNTKGNDHEDW